MGDLIGARQSGGFELRHARLPADADLLGRARELAGAAHRGRPRPSQRAEHARLRERAVARAIRGAVEVTEFRVRVMDRLREGERTQDAARRADASVSLRLSLSCFSHHGISIPIPSLRAGSALPARTECCPARAPCG